MRLVGGAFVVCVCLLMLLGGTFAQDISPGSEALLTSVLADVGAQTGDVARQHAFNAHLSELKAAAAVDPALGLATAYLASRFAADAEMTLALAGDNDALTRPLSDAQFSGAALAFAEANAAASAGIPPTQLELYKFGTSWDNLMPIGKALIGGAQSPELKSLIDTATKVYKAGKSADEYLNGNDPDVAKIISDFLDLIPSGLSPALSGPTSVAFGDLMNWNAGMWDQTTKGVDLINDAIRTGTLDQEKLGQVTQQLKLLAGQGPWGKDTAKKMLDSWLGNFPKLKKLIGALWPDQPPPRCGMINCNCGAIEAGILTGGWRDACRQGEAALLAQCSATGTISGSCGDPAGPGAFPP